MSFKRSPISRPPSGGPATLLSLPPESIIYIAELLTATEVPECLFERDQVWKTACVYAGNDNSLALSRDEDEDEDDNMTPDGSVSSAQYSNHSDPSPDHSPSHRIAMDRSTGSRPQPPTRKTSNRHGRHKKPVPDDSVTMQGVRKLASVCRGLRATLRSMLFRRVRIVSQDNMDWMLGGGTSDLQYIRDLRLLPTRHILSHASQLEILRRISPGQLLVLALALQPYLLADNVRFGFEPAEDAMGDVVRRAGVLQPEQVYLYTNLLGVSPSLPHLNGLKALIFEDAGVWDGGDTAAYTGHISPQHRVLSELLHNSAPTLERLILRRKINTRPRDYGHVNFDALLFQEGLSFPNLSALELRRCTITLNSLKTMLETHPKIDTLRFYPERSVQLPELPDTLRHLYTNSHLPASAAAVPKNIEALCVTSNGPLLPTPEQDFVPPLPNTLSTLHARLLPSVTERQITKLLRYMLKLEDIELVVKPLPWTDCACEDVSDQTGESISYDEAWGVHKRNATSTQRGWQEPLDIPAIASILSKHEHLHTFTFNHDMHLIDQPFPDIRHNGRTGTDQEIPVWWAANQATYEKDVRQLLDLLPTLKIVRWKVCERQREAWAIWQKESDGALSAVLLVERED